ncbi:hypothetical protein JG688_00015339 [Phytophthora aleatoria]|uniref:DUF659 domain-containing protein n=1 Tax=Phytophthora aleatoria TaxID=2496075 RepID=A0A8J5LWX9_9STRA|nr:hypothetical protein JG688_00015339 [Phytophthora aleatoria]
MQLRADKMVVVPAGAKRSVGLAAPAPGPPAKRINSQLCGHYLIDTITENDAARVDAALANLVFRTGISFRAVASNAMKEFVRALRPSYVERMPSARSIVGKIINTSYNKMLKRVLDAIPKARWFSLVSDGGPTIRTSTSSAMSSLFPDSSRSS